MHGLSMECQNDERAEEEKEIFFSWSFVVFVVFVGFFSFVVFFDRQVQSMLHMFAFSGSNHKLRKEF